MNELMELVDEYVENTFKSLKGDVFHFWEVDKTIRDRIQSIADDYERTKQERDKLLRKLQEINSRMFQLRDKYNEKNNDWEYHLAPPNLTREIIKGNSELIKECEDK